MAQEFFKSGAEKISKEADCTASGQPTLLRAVPMGKQKKFLYVQSEAVFFNISPLSLTWRAWPCPPSTQGYRQEVANLKSHQSPLSPGRTGSDPLALLAEQVVWFPQHPGGLLLCSLNPGTVFPELTTPDQRTQYQQLP